MSRGEDLHIEIVEDDCPKRGFAYKRAISTGVHLSYDRYPNMRKSIKCLGMDASVYMHLKQASRTFSLLFFWLNRF